MDLCLKDPCVSEYLCFKNCARDTDCILDALRENEYLKRDYIRLLSELKQGSRLNRKNPSFKTDCISFMQMIIFFNFFQI
jgi:hypothetical protein